MRRPAADFEELFVGLGGGEVRHVVDGGILPGGDGEFAFGIRAYFEMVSCFEHLESSWHFWVEVSKWGRCGHG